MRKQLRAQAHEERYASIDGHVGQPKSGRDHNGYRWLRSRCHKSYTILQMTIHSLNLDFINKAMKVKISEAKGKCLRCWGLPYGLDESDPVIP
jgi:hypothetical protein